MFLDSKVTNSVSMPQFISILGVHSGLDKAGVVKSLPWSLQAQDVWVYLDHGLAVVKLLAPISASVLSKVCIILLLYIILKFPLCLKLITIVLLN